MTPAFGRVRQIGAIICANDSLFPPQVLGKSSACDFLLCLYKKAKWSKLFILAAAAAAAGEASSQARLMMRRMDNVYPLMPISNASLHTNVFQECAHFLAFLVNVAPMNRRIQLNFEDCQFKNLATKKRSLCVTGSSSPESSMGPFCVTRSNLQLTDPSHPTHYRWKNLDPTQYN